MRFATAAILPFLLSTAASPPIDPTAASYPFAWTARQLSGPGADHLREAVRGAQFVLVGEAHHNRDIPLFTRVLYDQLRRENGFNHLAVEQDPLGIELALAPGQRGKAAAIGAALRRWPTLLGFASDQDLDLLADAGAVPGPDPIWGLEQAQSPVRYLEELVTLAPEQLRPEAARLLARARAEDRTRADFGAFLAYDPATLADLTRLRTQWSPRPATRAAMLLDGLVTSAQIYRYYVRGKAEHDPSLLYLNATVREAWLKAQLVRNYRRSAASGSLPKVVFKFGDNHIRRGVGNTGAWTLGTFASDLATFDGESAYTLLVVPIGDAIPDWAHLPAELRPLLPATAPPGPELVDLAALRGNADTVLAAASPDARDRARAALFGFDAIIVLPNSAPATWTLTGFPPP